jgi:fatty acid desaturase
VIPFREVQKNGWIVVGDDVFDISRFAARHPGGEEITQLRGSDATFTLINAHGVCGELPSLPKKLRIGTVDTQTLRPVDRELRAMWQDFTARGLFVYRKWWFALDLLRGVGFFVLAWLILDITAAGAFAALTIARLNAMWWVHDVCHDSVFRDRAFARRWAELVSIVFVGTSVLDYQYKVHRKHHGFTNTIGADEAIATGPVVWHELMRSRTSDTFVAVQSWFWFVVVLPLTLPYFLFIGIRQNVRDRAYLTILAIVARWTFLIWAFSDHLVVVIGSGVVSAYMLGLTASLNHFHRPMSNVNDWNFARSVTCVTQNLGPKNRFSAWLLGGLTYHIEHHFFATMPRRNYRRIAPELRALCERHGLEYSHSSFVGSLVRLWKKLRDPYNNNEPPVRPSMMANGTHRP